MKTEMCNLGNSIKLPAPTVLSLEPMPLLSAIEKETWDFVSRNPLFPAVIVQLFKAGASTPAIDPKRSQSS